MSTYTKLIWPVVDKTAVCLLQAKTSAPYTLTLNGTFVNPSIPDQISFARFNIIRSVSITATTGTYTGINFIIEGLQNSAYVTETLAGPAPNSTVYGAKHYDIIIKITASAAVAAPGVSVGTGSTGYFPLLVVNPNVTSINYAATILIPLLVPASGITYSLLQTLDQVSDNFIPLDGQLTRFFPCMGLTDKTTSEFATATSISNFLLLKISSTNPLTDTFNFIFLQQ